MLVSCSFKNMLIVSVLYLLLETSVNRNSVCSTVWTPNFGVMFEVRSRENKMQRSSHRGAERAVVFVERVY